ncbi:MAG: YbaK/EbsC family protein [Rehaibacterium terrae]|uniref:YbaK/EbsC family protein n=1 Tax=Rehaibacterium terrae TaxID=1341696 RepID=UPI00391D1BF2
MNDTLPKSARKVQAALEAAGLAAQVTELPQSARTAVDAANALGCTVAQIAKSLVFRCASDGSAVLVIASGPNRVDEGLIAARLGSAIGKADADFVRAATGFAIGGVPPLAHPAPLRTLIDADLLAFERVWAAAGTPNAVFPLDPRELVRITGGEVAAVTAKTDG